MRKAKHKMTDDPIVIRILKSYKKTFGQNSGVLKCIC
jgi:hypothetical protein